MKVGPLRRIAGALGLLALAPTAVLLAVGVLTPGDAAVRALATLVGVIVVERLSRWWLSTQASALERLVEDDVEEPRPPVDRRKRAGTPADRRQPSGDSR